MPWSVVTDKLDGTRIVYDVVYRRGGIKGIWNIFLEGDTWNFTTHKRLRSYSHNIGWCLQMTSNLGKPWTLGRVDDAWIDSLNRLHNRIIYPRVDGFGTRRAATEHRLYQMGIYEYD